MKTSFISLFALTGLFASSCVATPVSTAAVEKRQSDAALSIVTGLLSTIQGFDTTINSTTATITPASTDDEKTAATGTVNNAISNITAAVNSATTSVQAIPASKKRGDLATRQTASATDIADVIGEILEELSGTLNGVESTIGLGAVSDFTIPLGTSLSQLLNALEVVVNDLLAVVQELLDGILSGLSSALSGVTL